MSEVKINKDYRWYEARNAAQSLEMSIKTTGTKCEELISYVQITSWNGRARDAFLSYLEIISQYNNELKEAAALQTQAILNLEGYFNDFESDSEVQKVRNI